MLRVAKHGGLDTAFQSKLPFFWLPNGLLIRIVHADELNAYPQPSCYLLYLLTNPLLFHHVQKHQVKVMMHTMNSGDYLFLKRLTESGISTELFGDQTQK